MRRRPGKKNVPYAQEDSPAGRGWAKTFIIDSSPAELSEVRRGRGSLHPGGRGG
jgi:hypothetical protein